MFDYCFSENGLVAYKAGQQIGQQSIAKFLGEENLTRLLDWTLHYLSTIKIPVKRGTFIEFRAGMLNISPVGRNCSQEERDAFEKFDEVRPTVDRSPLYSIEKDQYAHSTLTLSLSHTQCVKSLKNSLPIFAKPWLPLCRLSSQTLA
jgi:phosphomannomutase